MKNVAYLLCGLLVTSAIIAKETSKPVKPAAKPQETYRALGVGYFSPFFAVSGKYGFTQHSAVQVLISPFGTGSLGLTSYTTRYIYKTPELVTDFKKNGRTIGCPYAFSGIGLLRWSDNISDFLQPDENNTTSSVSYSFGAGYELLFNGKFSISAEAIYNKSQYAGVESLKGVKFGISGHCRLAKSKLFKLFDPYVGSMPPPSGFGAASGINTGKKAGKKGNASVADENAEEEGDEEAGAEKSDTTAQKPALPSPVGKKKK